MFAVDSSAIAEHVGSLVRYIEKKHATGRPLGPTHLVRAVRLRAVGVRGDLTDVALIRRALAEYFRRSHFESHFFVKE